MDERGESFWHEQGGGSACFAGFSVGVCGFSGWHGRKKCRVISENAVLVCWKNSRELAKWQADGEMKCGEGKGHWRFEIG